MRDYPRYEFLAFLLQCRQAIATDPRDKIYSLLGLAEELFDGHIPDLSTSALIIDYRATVEDVYSSLVRAVVEATQRLDILGLCSRSEHGRIQRTWTPDWTNGRVGILDGEIMLMKDWFNFDATPDFDGIATFASDLSSLTVTGFIFDHIVLMSSAYEYGDFIAMEQFKADCRKMLELLEERRARHGDQALPQGKDIEELLLRTVMNNTVMEEKPYDDWRPFFQDWMKRGCASGDDKPTNASEDFLIWIQNLSAEMAGCGTAGELLSSSLIKPEELATARRTDTSLGLSNELSNPSLDYDSGFKRALHTAMNGYPRIILTHNGYIARSRITVQEKDLICVVLGCVIPLILRPVNDHFEIVGEVYVEGIMNGEALATFQEKEGILQEFELR
jgi:hypothetical protein